MIDAGPKGNLARYINHSCDPNCQTEPWIVNSDKRIGIFAIRDIMPDQELTFNYQLEQCGDAKESLFNHRALYFCVRNLHGVSITYRLIDYNL